MVTAVIIQVILVSTVGWVSNSMVRVRTVAAFAPTYLCLSGVWDVTAWIAWIT